nr:hypothetical protein HUO10_005427 [Paraburkholderia busanensis]
MPTFRRDQQKISFFVNVLLAFVLTVPIFLGVTQIDALLSWLYSESGYRMLSPLFSLFGAVGVEGHVSVIAGLLLAVSFIASVGIVSFAFNLIGRRRRPNA